MTAGDWRHRLAAEHGAGPDHDHDHDHDHELVDVDVDAEELLEELENAEGSP